MKQAVFASLFLSTVLSVGPSCAPSSSWEELHAKSLGLEQQGRYGEAERVGQEALRVAEARFGPDHPNVARSLIDLADLYRIHQGKYFEAEPLYKRALSIWERVYGSNHSEVATVLEKMRDLYRRTGRKDEAERAEARAREIDRLLRAPL